MVVVRSQEAESRQSSVCNLDTWCQGTHLVCGRMWWFIPLNFFCFSWFCTACTLTFFSKSKGQVISHIICHMQVTWWIMGQVMWWVRWHVMWWLTNTSCAPTWWLSCWLSAKPWWLTTKDAISICGYAYWSDDSTLINLVMWPLLSSCVKDCVCYPESPSWPLVVLGLS
jgi:hypothetical protein